MERQIRTPYLVVNPKAYLYGQKSLELALAADQASEDFDIDIFFTTNFADLRLIKENTKNIILTAQHMQSLRPGRGMGHVLPESLVDAGAEAVFLNHAENPLTVNELYACIKRCKELGLYTIACADSVVEAEAICVLGPSCVLAEPTELIGTGIVADNSYIDETIRRLRKVNPDVHINIASGITTADDVYNVIYHGADGTGATSGILKAEDPKLRIREMAEAVKRAASDRK